MHESGCTGSVSVRTMRTESLPFSSLPSQTKLFLDYIADPLSLKRFYPSATTPGQVSGRAGQMLESYTADRGRLCAILHRQNETFGAGPEAAANIELLRKPQTVAVLTGQQTGLFTGPLYSIYKALSAVRQAECLRSCGVDAVPVFWMATEDHDLEEVSAAFAIGRENEVFEARFVPGPDDEAMPVGRVRLNDSAGAAAAVLFDRLPHTEYTAELRRWIDASWRPEARFGEAFGRFLTSLLGRFGLIVVDPLDDDIKELASPIYAAAAEKGGEIVNALRARTAELEEAGYHAQVLVEEDYFPMFWHDDAGRRTGLRRAADGTLRTRQGRRSFSASELAALAAAEPSRLSPSVMLRPVVQDFLFPTICYVGGAAEVAYFAQVSEVYRILGRPVTPVFHRQSFTVIEPRHARTLSKYGLSFAELLSRREQLIPEIIDRFIDPGSARLFADVEERVNTELNRLDQALSRLDVTLAENLATRRRKVLYHITALRNKYYRRRAVTDEIINRRVRAAFDSLLPNGQLQERVLCIVSFLDRYGPGFLDAVYDSIDIDDTGHRLIYL